MVKAKELIALTVRVKEEFMTKRNRIVNESLCLEHICQCQADCSVILLGGFIRNSLPSLGKVRCRLFEDCGGLRNIAGTFWVFI